MFQKSLGCDFSINCRLFIWLLMRETRFFECDFIPNNSTLLGICSLVAASHRLTRPLHGADVPFTRFVLHNLYKK